jgi:serine protease Do
VWRRATSSPSFDGKPIEKGGDLPRLVGNTKPGTKSSLTVFRRGAHVRIWRHDRRIEPDKVAKKTADKEEKPKSPMRVTCWG